MIQQIEEAFFLCLKIYVKKELDKKRGGFATIGNN